MKLSSVVHLGTKYTVIAIVFISTLEICARIDDAIRFNAPLLETYTTDRLRMFDKDGLQINVPNAGFEKWHNNSLGFRGPEISEPKSPEVIRLFCLGASESYGTSESEGNEWPGRLRTLLPESRYQVINASVAGLTLRSFKSYLHKHVMQHQPDIIVLVINPYFYSSLIEREKEGIATREKQSLQDGKNPPTPLKARIINNIRFVSKFKQVLKNCLHNNFPTLLQNYQIWNLKKQINEIEFSMLKGRKPFDTVDDATIKAFKRDLSDLVSFLQARHVEVILTTYPSLINHSNTVVSQR